MDTEIKLKSLAKALRVLEYFQIERPEAGVSKISEYLGYHKSNVHDILKTLEAFGYVEQNPKTREYRLGYQIIRRGFVYNNAQNANQLIQELLLPTVDQIGESAYYGTIRDQKVLYLGQCIPKNTQWLLTDYGNVTGFMAPLYCTGLGKALIAYQDDAYIESVADQGFEPFTSNTITSREQLWDEIYRIRECGYAVDNMEHVYGVKCVGVPIFDDSGKVMLSVSVHGMSVRFSEDRIVEIAQMLKAFAVQMKGRIRL